MTTPTHRAEQFGYWLSAELKRRGSSGPALAKAIGSRRGTVYKWTAGWVRPAVANCYLIADYLGVEPDLVLDVAGYRHYDITVDGDVRRELVELIARTPEALLVPFLPAFRGLADPAAQGAALQALRTHLDED